MTIELDSPISQIKTLPRAKLVISETGVTFHVRVMPNFQDYMNEPTKTFWIVFSEQNEQVKGILERECLNAGVQRSDDGAFGGNISTERLIYDY